MRASALTVSRWGLSAALLIGGGPAWAAAVDPALFPFLGSPATPAAAASAGTALADRWLGDLPFDNPAFRAQRGLELSPALIHVSRQDLRAANRNYVETSGYLDGAGGGYPPPPGRAPPFGSGRPPGPRFTANPSAPGRAPAR